jgi:hypothetical protein
MLPASVKINIVNTNVYKTASSGRLPIFGMSTMADKAAASHLSSGASWIGAFMGANPWPQTLQKTFSEVAVVDNKRRNRGVDGSVRMAHVDYYSANYVIAHIDNDMIEWFVILAD